jgi:hypothetical protein
MPEGIPLAEFVHPNRRFGFVLAPDGRRLARQVEVRQIEVRDVLEGGKPLLLTTLVPNKNEVRIDVGDDRILIMAGKHCHWVRWDRSDLEHRVFPRKELAKEWLAKRKTLQPGLYDPHRFVQVCYGALSVACDCFGQIAILDDRIGSPVCMFFVSRHEIAGWMPDGTRWGSQRLLGTAPHPLASQKFVEALRAAAHAARERSRS